jgi:hypothetical protein
MIIIYWPRKKPSEELDYTLDWSNVLDNDDIIVSSSWIMPDTTSLLKTNEYFDHHETTVWLSGGDATESPYVIRNLIVTDLDSTYAQDVFLPIWYTLHRMCLIKGIISDADGEPEMDIECVFNISNNPSIVGNIGIASEQHKVCTDSNGYFETSLIIGASYKVYISELGIVRSFMVPDSTTADLFSLIS